MRTLVLICSALAAGLPASAEMIPLPVDLPLEHGTIVTDLRDDILEVIIDDGEAPSLRIYDAVTGEMSEGFVSLDVDEALNILRILRPHGDAVTAPPLRVELTLSRAHALEMLGEGFDATVTDPFVEEDQARSAGGEARYKVRADDARVTLRGVGGIDLHGSGNNFELSMTSSPLTAALASGSLDIEDHVGDLRVNVENTDVTLALATGTMNVSLSGGSLDAREGTGLIRAEATGASVRVESWQGSVDVRGEATLVEVARSGSEESLVELEGLDHTLVVEEFLGGVIARMRGGEARLKTIGQRVQVTGEEATRVQLEGVGGAATLKLSSGANAKASRVTGKLDARIDDGELVAEEVRDLDVKLTRSNAELTSKDGRVRVRAMDSDVSLNLESEIALTPSFEALGSSRIEVSMREPCIVAVKGDESMADLIDAGGCDMRASGRRSPARRGAGPTTLVTARVTPGASLEITSR